jgi:hypothetical protein
MSNILMSGYICPEFGSGTVNVYVGHELIKCVVLIVGHIGTNERSHVVKWDRVETEDDVWKDIS